MEFHVLPDRNTRHYIGVSKKYGKDGVGQVRTLEIVGQGVFI